MSSGSRLFTTDRVKLVVRHHVSAGCQTRAFEVHIVPSEADLRRLHQVGPVAHNWARHEGVFANVHDAVLAALAFIGVPCRIVCDVERLDGWREFKVRDFKDRTGPSHGYARIQLGNLSPSNRISVSRAAVAL